MRDLTIVIPTYNRPHLLASLVNYLEAERAECHVLIADSSKPEARDINRRLASSVKLDLRYSEFPVEMHPFDKFREAAQMVETPFCALCADDDLIVLDGVQRSLDALRNDPHAAVAQGYSFSFLCQSNGEMDIGGILYFTPTINEATPLARVARLFDCYQAATYGNFRTPVLQRIFESMRPLQSILARELSGSALAAVEGTMIRVPHFSHGRSLNASETYEHWHPLEWFIKDAQGLFTEYHHYRELIAQRVLQRADNDRDPAAVRRILDVIHLRYCTRHAPDAALRFIIEQRLAGVPFAQFWPRPEIHAPLHEAARVGSELQGSALSLVVKRRNGNERTYNLHPNFVSPLGVEPPASVAIGKLLESLNNYRIQSPSPATADVTVLDNAPSPVRANALPLRTITVSVLLCSYNHARFLPESLAAICTQTQLPEELIVFDDGSTDNSLQIIEEFARCHPFIRVLRNETNRGLLYSINRALAEARCDFVVWAAADGRLMPTFLERNAQYLRRHSTAGIACSRLAELREGSDEIVPHTDENHPVALDFGTDPISPIMLQQQLQESYPWISANTVMASRVALLRAGGFDPELRWHAAYFAFWVVTLREGAVCIPETLAAMRKRAQTYSSTDRAKRKEQLATLGRLADKLTTKGWRDIGLAFLRCPALMSPFGGEMLEALLRKARRWPFALTYGLWFAHHQWQGQPGIAARLGSRLARGALKCLGGILTRASRMVG